MVVTMIPDSIMKRTDLTLSAKMIYGRMLRYAWWCGQCWASVDTLARELGGNRKTIMRGIKSLESKGLIGVEDRGHGKSNKYHLVVQDFMTTGPIVVPVQNWSKPVTEAPRPLSDKECDAILAGETGEDLGLVPKLDQSTFVQNQSQKGTSTGPKKGHKETRKKREELREQKGSRAPDPIWDTMAEIFFPSGVAPGDRTRLGKLVRDLKGKNAQADQIKARRRNLEAIWSDCRVTPESLVKHWDLAGECNGKPPAQPSPHRYPEKLCLKCKKKLMTTAESCPTCFGDLTPVFKLVEEGA